MSEIEKYPEVEKWLVNKSKGTVVNYKAGMDAYIEFTKLNPTELIDEAEADREKKVRERGEPELKVKKFKQWLMTEYRQRTHGPRNRSKKRRDKIGISEGLANMYCSAMKSFYRANGFRLDVKLGKARKRKENFKLIVRADEISKLLSVATSLRDKAIIKLMYESCQGVSEVCVLNCGDLKHYDEDGLEVWQVHLVRKKTNTEYYTEIGEEAIELLKLYFEERKRNGEVLSEDSPVFVKEGRQKFSRGRITSNLIENMLKTLAIKSGLVTKEQMEAADMNPARPHSLRAGGMSVLKLTGYPEKAVEFRCGHTLNGNDEAYWLTRPDELRQLFRKYYNALRVRTGTSQVTEERIKRLENMLAEREITVNALQENGKLKVSELQRLREELMEQKKAIKDLSKLMEEKIEEITRKLWEKWLHEQYEADREAIRDLQKWREQKKRAVK